MEQKKVFKHTEDSGSIMLELGITGGSSGSNALSDATAIATEHSKVCKSLVSIIKSMDTQERLCRSLVVSMKMGGKQQEAKDLSSFLALFSEGLDGLKLLHLQNKELPDPKMPEARVEAVKNLQGAVADGNKHLTGLAFRMEPFKGEGK